jgi:transposase
MEDIAKRFQVSEQWIYKLQRRFNDEKTLEPKPHGGGQPLKVSEELEQRLCDKLLEQPDASLAELRDHLGISGSIMAVFRALKRLGITRKKNGACQGTRRSRDPGTTSRMDESATCFRSATPVFPGRNEC